VTTVQENLDIGVNLKVSLHMIQVYSGFVVCNYLLLLLAPNSYPRLQEEIFLLLLFSSGQRRLLDVHNGNVINIYKNSVYLQPLLTQISGNKK
jgi:hypothetical protein